MSLDSKDLSGLSKFSLKFKVRSHFVCGVCFQKPLEPRTFGWSHICILVHLWTFSAVLLAEVRGWWRPLVGSPSASKRSSLSLIFISDWVQIGPLVESLGRVWKDKSNHLIWSQESLGFFYLYSFLMNVFKTSLSLLFFFFLPLIGGCINETQTLFSYSPLFDWPSGTLCTGCNLVLRLFGPESVSSFSKGPKFLLQVERNFSKSGSDETFVNFEFQTATYQI